MYVLRVSELEIREYQETLSQKTRFLASFKLDMRRCPLQSSQNSARPSGIVISIFGGICWLAEFREVVLSFHFDTFEVDLRSRKVWDSEASARRQ